MAITMIRKDLDFEAKVSLREGIDRIEKYYCELI